MRKTDKPVKTPPAAPDGNETEEGNWIDKSIKELFQASFLNFVRLILKLPGGESYRPAHIELQRTVERRTDFLGQWFKEPEKKSLLHLEVQAEDAHKMIYRELLYAALLFDEYPDWELEQIVLCLSEKRPTMPTQLKKRRTSHAFRLIWIKDVSYRDFLRTGDPGLMTLAVLADFKGKTAHEVMEEVVNSVHAATSGPEEFRRFSEILHNISMIHKLQPIFHSVMGNMFSKLVDIKTDPYWIEGKLEGKLEGILEKSVEGAINLILRSDHDDEFIASILGLEAATVAKVRALVARYPKNFREKLHLLDAKVFPEKNGKPKVVNGH